MLQQTVDPVVCLALLPIFSAIVIDVIHAEIHFIPLTATSASVTQFCIENGLVLCIITNRSMLSAISVLVIFG